MTGSGDTEALQAALAGEHAAVYLFGVLGARADGVGLVARLSAAYDAHAAARDVLAERVHALGATPVGPAAAYSLPSGLHGDHRLRSYAATVENRLVALYVQQAGEATGSDRRLLATSAGACAVRALGFGAAPSPTPGLERAQRP